jgi:hypothetical protein
MAYSYVIAIPSYKRHKTIQEKTLKVLEEYNIDKTIVNIFVADQTEYELYEPLGYKTIVAKPGLHNARNFILDYFPKDTRILFCDDDIKGFKQYDALSKRSEKPLENLKDVIENGWNMAMVTRSRLWGLYPVPNGYFMNNTISHTLKFISGPFFGLINPGKELRHPMSEKEDYYRTLRMFQMDGAVVRLNFVSAVTDYYKGEGGMQTNPDRIKDQEFAVSFLKNEFEGHVYLNTRRKSKFPEIRIK